jgi:3',5'-cyclic AMP phosphodiesterase CpdA
VITVAHVSDLHLDGSSRNAERAARALAQVGALPVDVVMVTGDLTDHGLPAEYEELRPLLPAGVLLCPGNHDERGAYRQILLGEPPGDGPVNRLHHAAGAVFAMCDSTVPGEAGGYLADETLDWLDAALGGGEPAFVCFHHPPVELHIPFIDEIRQRGQERLSAVLARHPQVVAILCGHAHTPAATTFAGLPLRVAPGVVSTIRLPWESGDDIDRTAPAAVALHILGDDGRLTTHYRVVDDAPTTGHERPAGSRVS